MVDYKATLTIEKTPGIASEITNYVLSEWGLQRDSKVEQPYYFSGCAIHIWDLDEENNIIVALHGQIESDLEDTIEPDLNGAIERLQGKFPDLKLHRIKRVFTER